MAASVHERERVLAALRRHGWNATSFQVLEPHFRYWFHGDDGLVAYVDTGRAWVAAGAPIAAAEVVPAAAEGFVAAARAARRRACFFATEDRFNQAIGYPTLLVGEQPIWDPQRWEEALKESPSLRAQLRRASAKRVVTRLADPAEVAAQGRVRQSMERLATRWLGARTMAPMGFLVQLRPFEDAAERRYVLAERGGELVGFLAAVPVYARGGWLFENLLRDPDAPNGTTELLVDAGMRAAAAEGCRYVTLGLVPLSGPVRGWLRVARSWVSGLYDFHGLKAFKAKLKPSSWEPISLTFPPGRLGSVALYDTLAAFASGGLLRFGLRTLLRGPTLVVQALAVLLIPWTALLAAADAGRWFPAPWVKWAWVAFDAVLVLGLLALAQEWRRWLSTLLASLISLDAAITLGEVVAFNLPRGGGVVPVGLAVLATLAPALAALVLWTSRAHRLGSAALTSAGSLGPG
jgi:phosphatidylglycerol lysyltransferase